MRGGELSQLINRTLIIRPHRPRILFPIARHVVESCFGLLECRGGQQLVR